MGNNFMFVALAAGQQHHVCGVIRWCLRCRNYWATKSRLSSLGKAIMGFLSAFVVSRVVVVNGQQHHVCGCALALLIADGLIADGQQHHVCGVMRSRS